MIRRDGDFELEDIIGEELYDRAVQQAYPDKPVERPGDAEGKRTKRYEKAYRDIHDIGYNKRRVAETLKAVLRETGRDGAGLDGLRNLMERIWAALQEQVRLKDERDHRRHE